MARLIALFLLIAVGLTGCAVDPAARPLTVRVSFQNEMQPCRYLGQVVGTAANSPWPQLSGREKAEYDARDLAAQLGATHIVWTGYTDKPVATVTGRAYRCPRIDGPGPQRAPAD